MEEAKVAQTEATAALIAKADANSIGLVNLGKTIDDNGTATRAVLVAMATAQNMSVEKYLESLKKAQEAIVKAETEAAAAKAKA